MSSMNYAKYSRRRKDFVFKTVFENSFDTIIEFLTAMRELGIKPEHECFDAGHVANLDPILDMGLLEQPLQISLVMGVTGGIRPTPRNVTLMSDQVPGGAEGPNQWQVIGISRDQWKLLGSALVLGGNVRAGVEDNLYLPDGTMVPLQRRPDRQGAADGRRRRPPPGDRRRGPRAARHHRPLRRPGRLGRRPMATKQTELLRMGELAEASGVPAPTIKHYLREGLLPEGVKTSRNMAYYPPEFVDRIRLIKRLQEERFMPLKAIKGVLDEGTDRAEALLALEDQILDRALAGEKTRTSAADVRKRLRRPQRGARPARRDRRPHPEHAAATRPPT